MCLKIRHVRTSMDFELAQDYHMYCAIWIPMLGEVLICKRELDNTQDRYSVAILKDVARCQKYFYNATQLIIKIFKTVMVIKANKKLARKYSQMV